MQKEQVEQRLASLKKELETGQTRLAQLEAEQAYVRETMLRISGAIQVLEELVDESIPDPADGNANATTEGTGPE
jgi:predicted nuclease with TOPRIM domain